MLEDQFNPFGPVSAAVRPPAMYCTPVDKTYEGTTEPMLRPDAHLVCYPVEFFTPPINPPGVPFLDEFMLGDAPLSQRTFLCVPTLKHEVVPALPTSWGNIKAMYR